MTDIVERINKVYGGLAPYERGVCAKDALAAAAEIERLRAAGDALVAAIRNHDLREEHIKAWEARRG